MDVPEVMFRDQRYFVPPEIYKAYAQHLIFVGEASFALEGFAYVKGATSASIEAHLLHFTHRYDPGTNGFKMTPEEIQEGKRLLQEALVKWIVDACALSGALHYLASEFEGYLVAERRDAPEVAK